MNKINILELSKQADQATDEYLACEGEFHPDYATTWNKEFTKLIIGECAKAIQEVMEIRVGNPSPVYDQGFRDGLFVAIRSLDLEELLDAS